MSLPRFSFQPFRFGLQLYRRGNFKGNTLPFHSINHYSSLRQSQNKHVDPIMSWPLKKPLDTIKDVKNALANPPVLEKKSLESTHMALKKMQNSYPHIFAQIQIRGHRFHVVRGDLIITTRLKNTAVGDILKFNKVYEIGTETCTIKNKDTICPDYFHITGMVIEHGRGKKVLARIGKTRRRHIKKLTHKPFITLIRVRDIRLVTPDVPAPQEPLKSSLLHA